MIGLAITIGIICFLRFTNRGKQITRRLRFKWEVWKHEKLHPWFKENKGNAFFTTLEKARWFPWYGKRVIYVKAKKNLTVTERDVKEAINAKDYEKALSIIKELPDSPKTVALKQVIESKLNS